MVLRRPICIPMGGFKHLGGKSAATVATTGEAGTQDTFHHGQAVAPSSCPTNTNNWNRWGGRRRRVGDSPPSSPATRYRRRDICSRGIPQYVIEFECFHKNHFEECSAVTTRCVNTLYNIESSEPFGGSFCLLVGDRHQTLPINKGISNDQATLYAMVRASPLFGNFTTVLSPKGPKKI